MLFLVILLVLIFGGGGYYGGNAWRPGYGGGISLGTVLVILLVCYLLGVFGPRNP